LFQKIMRCRRKLTVQDQYELPFHTVSLYKDAFWAYFGETG
jgi:hypothetical protein